jgi:hypothetical protein
LDERQSAGQEMILVELAQRVEWGLLSGMSFHVGVKRPDLVAVSRLAMGKSPAGCVCADF